MLSAPFQYSLVLTGPTGSGKSRLAIDLAARLDAEIVSMDSMTLYRGMDIGTAKPTLRERRDIPHHLIDVLDPWESASVAWWLKQAATCCQAIEARGKQPLFVGGTPLYLKALMCGIFDGPPADAAVRQRLADEAEAGGGPAALHARLERVDAVSARRIHRNDLRRLVRALEVHEVTGRPLSAWQTQWPASRDTSAAAPTTPRILCLDLPRTELHERIDRRVEAMFANGFIDEVERLRRLARPLGREAAKALGYREVMDHLDGKTDRAQTIALVQMRSRQFAKRQLTWFRHLPGCLPTTKELTWTHWRRTMER